MWPLVSANGNWLPERWYQAPGVKSGELTGWKPMPLLLACGAVGFELFFELSHAA